ncbi:MAG TPA: ThuA domain-containing protein [Steroidobacteraceae bacterium]|nr:ThuA domain-containing protein [Steroidobacteraceae bacterium]
MATRIILVAGQVKAADLTGHHDYAAGCALLAHLLEQTAGVAAEVVRDGWPADENLFAGARAVVFYTAGGGRQPFLQMPERWERLRVLAGDGVGLVLLHQAVDFPADHVATAAAWFGGATERRVSKRGHWMARHADFPSHPVTRGVTPFKARDGWLCEARFAADAGTVTPLLWARTARRAADVVAWAYERPGGGRSFCFSGLDAHRAWAPAGLRQLIVNGVLWSAGLEIPAAGAPCSADAHALTADLTPRASLASIAAALLGKSFRRITGYRERPAR